MIRIVSLAVLASSLVVALPSGAARIGAGKIVFAAESGIYAVSPDGSGLTLLHPCSPPTYRCVTGLSWSPDGSLIAFAGGGWSLQVMNAYGTTLWTIADPHADSFLVGQQAWSPDGQELAYGVNYQWGSYVMVATIGGGRRNLASESSPVSAPSWSPDGSLLAYSTQTELRLVPSTGGASRSIASVPGINDPTWSPDSRGIAFTDAHGIWIVNSDGSGLRQVVDGLTGSLSWSPDGSRLLFEKTVGYLGGYQYRDVFVVDANTLVQRRMTFDEGNVHPRWSPDGTQIAFLRRDLWLLTMNSDGTCLQTLAAERLPNDIAWQPLPHGPLTGPKDCHSLTVRATADPTSHGTAAVIRATLRNSGTEPLTDVRFVPPLSNDLTPTSIRTSRGGCSLRRDLVRCTIGALARDQEVRVTIRADGRRVNRNG